MGAPLIFLLLQFTVVFWGFPIHRSAAAHVANEIVHPAVSPTSSTRYPPRTGFGIHGGLKRPNLGAPAPYETRFRHTARLHDDIDGSHSYHKHHRHHHHRANNRSPSHGHGGVIPAYALSPFHSPHSAITSQTSVPASSPIFSQMPIHTPPSTLAFPPPPRNQDCTTLTCTEPLTYTLSGYTCGCVWPIQVKMRFNVALFTFFPLVSELAKEIASSLSLKQSQVRITGANEASQQLEKTIVLVNLVPLETKFNYSAAFSTYEKFWHKKILINPSMFGVYEVLDVHYPGLPPSPPPSIASDLAAIDDHSYPADHRNNDGSSLKPLGVNVPRKQNNRSDGRRLAVVVLSSITALVICASIMWVLTVRYQRSVHLEELAPTPVSSFIKPSGAARSLALGSRSLSGSLSFASGMISFTGSAKIYSLDDINRATNSFDSSRVLGEGGFGVVYLGTLDDGEEVAVKLLKKDSRHGGREFLSEVEMLSRLHHRNLVKLIGICTEDHVRCLVYELVPNGSVESHLHGVCKEVAPLDWQTRMKIALGSARGLAYLHEDSSPFVIHRDFKASNILLDHNFTPKVSDFGLARSAQNEGNLPISTHVIGTFGYLAPEYAMTGHLLVKSDVYSYGVVLLELLTGRKPVDFSKPPGQENLVAWAHLFLTTNEGLEAIMDPTLNPTTPFESFSKVAAIASMCVQPEVSRRPFMGEVVQALKLICSELEDAHKTQVEEAHVIEFEDTKSCQISGEFQEFSGVQYSDAKIAFSANDLTVERKNKEYDESFRRRCSSGPLGLGVKKKIWHRFGRFSKGSMKERLWSGSY